MSRLKVALLSMKRGFVSIGVEKCGLIVLDVVCQFLKAMTSFTPQGDRAPESGSISQIRRCCSEASVDWINVTELNCAEAFSENLVTFNSARLAAFLRQAFVNSQNYFVLQPLCPVALFWENHAPGRTGHCAALLFDNTVANEELSWNVKQTMLMWTVGKSLTHCFWNEERGSCEHTALIDD